MSADEIRGRDVELVAVDEANLAWDAMERIRGDKLAAAKREALAWLDRGDPAGALVKFVAETMKPTLAGSTAPLIDWTAAGTLLELGRASLPAPVDLEADDWKFQQMVAISASTEAMRRWIVRFR